MKKVLSFIICFILLMAFASCGNNDYIGIEKAKKSVADDIGAAVEDVEFTLNDLVTDDKGDYYSMKFRKDGTEYEYKIDALNGKIIEKKSNYTDYDDNSDVTEKNSETKPIMDNKSLTTNM